jgi:CRISPR/Cas system CMR-associated protein Cmr5 small subunit
MLGVLAYIPFIRRRINRWKKSRIIQKHERYRARRISEWNVLKHIDELENNGLFLEGDVLEKVRYQYHKWHQNAQEKQFEIEKEYPAFLKNHKFYLTKRNCLAMERELLNYFFERDIVTQRVYAAMVKSLKRRVHKIRRNALSEEEFGWE